MAFTAQQAFTLNSGTTPALSSTVAASVTFGYASNNTPIRYAYVAVENNTGFSVFVRTDGTAASNVGGDFNTLIPTGTVLVIANSLPLWTQAASVIPVGSDIGTGAGNPGWPGTPASPDPFPAGAGTPFGGSLYGGTANPGTNISVIAISGSTPTATTDVTVSGTG